jgi:hypothetical protein
MLTPLIGATVVAAAGWLVVPIIWRGREPAHYGRRVTAGLFCGVGVVCGLCYVSIYGCGRPRFLVPPSMRPGRHAVPGPHQAGGADRAPAEAPVSAPVDTSLQPGETLLARIMVNRVQDGRVYGGHVLVTSSRLLFEPVALSRARGGIAWAIPLAQVRAADVAPRGWNPRTAEWRHRLRVRTVSGQAEYFVVWRPRAAADLVEQVRQSQPGQAGLGRAERAGKQLAWRRPGLITCRRRDTTGGGETHERTIEVGAPPRRHGQPAEVGVTGSARS